MSHPDWHSLAQTLEIEGRAFIQGQYTTAISGRTFDCINPANGQCLTQLAQCDAEDAERAVNAARHSFESGVWAGRAPAQRKATLLALADLMTAHQETLALLESLDMGKSIGDSLNIDIALAINCVRWHAEAIDKIYDEVAPSKSNELAMITREPVGVVAAIVPWNFPLLISCWKIAPALATGNSVIVKPSEKASLTAIFLAGLAAEAGIPEGVLQVLPGYGHEVGAALALSHQVDCLAFTGSTGVAKRLLEYAGQSNMKKVWLEAGGKSPNLVFEDCGDVSAVAAAAAEACFYNQGEVCVAGSRLLVQRSILDQFMPLLLEAAQAFMPGDPLQSGTVMGPLVDQGHLQQVLQYVRLGQAEGATLAFGGQPLDLHPEGCFMQPTIFTEVNNQMRIAREEIFGPVLTVIPFEDEQEAIAIANDSDYGLAAAVWSQNINRAHRVAKALRAGSVWVNHYNGGDMAVPFGGFKQSGNGRDKSLHAFDKYTELKATVIKLS